MLCAQTILETSEIGHVKWVDCMLCELSQENSFKIKVDPELKHLLKHSAFPCSGETWRSRWEGCGGPCAGSSEAQGRQGGEPGILGTTATVPAREERALGAGHTGKRPKITENLKLQGEVEGSVVSSNGELLREGKEKFYSEGMESEARQGAAVGWGGRGKGFSHGNSQALKVLGHHGLVCLWKNPDGEEENIPIP